MSARSWCLGKPEESSLIQSIRHEGEPRKCPKRRKTPGQQIAALSEWVRMGMPWPEGDAPKLSRETGSRYKALVISSRCETRDSEHAGREDLGADPGGPLRPRESCKPPERRTRRSRRPAHLDPPCHLRSHRIATDDRGGGGFRKGYLARAFARSGGRLLASPRYGERWGRHWLDVARYADSKGYVFQEERRYPYSYTYRDWVIRASQ